MRIVRKLYRSKLLLGGLLAALSFLFFTWSLSHGSTNLDKFGEGDVFYDDDINHWFVVKQVGSKPFQRVVEDPVEFIPNRKRILMTSFGMVQVKDFLFVPVKALKRGQSLTEFSRQVDNDFKNLVVGSNNQGQGPTIAKDQDTSRFNSILQQMREKNEQRGANLDSGRSHFLNSEKMLALQAQMRAREIQSIKKDTKDSDLQKKKEAVSIAQTNSTACTKQLCAEFLSSFDLPHFRYCKRKSKVRSDREPPQSQCNFLNSTGRNAVALASHPGSGHLLVRELLQKATGICTGGVNCDVRLRRNGYPGECLRSGVVLVVKSHQTEPRWTGIQYDNSVPYKGFNKVIDIPVYGSAILLVRDPFDALADLWQQMKKEGIITDERWNDYLFEQATEWQQIMLAWTTTNHNHPLLIVKYEDLKQDSPNVLTEMLDFLQVPYSSFIVQELAMNLHVEEVSFTYSSDEKNYINSILKSTTETLRTHKLDTNCDLSLYLKE